MDDAPSEQVWREHEIWRRIHHHKRVEREAWTDTEWLQARRYTDVAWELNPEGLYVYAAERALRDVQYLRGLRFLRGS